MAKEMEAGEIELNRKEEARIWKRLDELLCPKLDFRAIGERLKRARYVKRQIDGYGIIFGAPDPNVIDAYIDAKGNYVNTDLKIDQDVADLGNLQKGERLQDKIPANLRISDVDESAEESIEIYGFDLEGPCRPREFFGEPVSVLAHEAYQNKKGSLLVAKSGACWMAYDKNASIVPCSHEIALIDGIAYSRLGASLRAFDLTDTMR